MKKSALLFNGLFGKNSKSMPASKSKIFVPHFYEALNEYLAHSIFLWTGIKINFARSLIKQIYYENNEMYILGDLNCNFLEEKSVSSMPTN